MNECRCGHTGDGPHPCHSMQYTCGKPATQRWYVPNPNVSLSGMQLKASACDTWACDDCWKDFQQRLAERAKVLGG